MPTVKGTTSLVGAGLPLKLGEGRPQSSAYQPTAITRATVGYMRIIIGGKDVTFFRGVPAEISTLTHGEPFGYQVCHINFPQITPFDDLTQTAFQWATTGHDVLIQLVKYVDGTPVVQEELFDGVVAAVTRIANTGGAGSVGVKIDCQGILYANADSVLAQPEIDYDTRDIGYTIARQMNAVKQRRYRRVAEVVTGITTRSTGAWEQNLTGRIGDLLGQATTSDGLQQWTLALDAGRKPVIRLKDYTTAHHSTAFGTPGVSIDINYDASTAATAIYGRGVDRNSRGWGNLKIPGYNSLENVAFFSNTASDTKVIGDTGAVITQIQTALKNIWHYPVTIDGTFGTNTHRYVKALQRGTGCKVTGKVDAQTWIALFQIGSRHVDFRKAYYAPLATTTSSQPYLYDSSGKVTGHNPAYDGATIPRERFHSYPDGTSKSEAAGFATAELARDQDPGQTGTITFEGVDPESTSRYAIKAGQNISIKNLGGTTKLFHIIEVSHTPIENSTILTVDTKCRDLLTMDAIKQRNRDSLGPGSSPYHRRRSVLTPGKPVVDGELIGRIPRIASSAQVWNVLAIPLGTEGNIVTVNLLTDTPATRFSMAFFSARVNPQQIETIVGNPWTSTNVGDAEYYAFPGIPATQAKLENIGWIDCLGGKNNRAGYFPGSEERGGTITGRHYDQSITLNFESFQPPFVWLAFYPESATFLEGQIYIAPQGS